MKKTFGEILTEVAQRRCSVDGFYADAVNDLAVAWLQSGRWSEWCDNPNTVLAAVRNKVRDLARKRRRHVDVDDTTGGYHPRTEEWLHAREMIASFKRALYVNAYQVLLLEAAGYTTSDMSALLAIRCDAVRARLARARALLARTSNRAA